MRKVFVDLKKEIDNSYEINILEGSARDALVRLDNDGAYFVIDRNVFDLYPYTREFKKSFVLDANEHNKSFSRAEEILIFLLESGCHRSGTLVALGGGITGDITGFVASVYMRGIDFVQVPTTLLSMVDSSVGGKTGVNLKHVKNIVGAFYQPKRVIIDPVFLDTLSFDELKNGVGEIIKYGLMFDTNLCNTLIQKREAILKRGEILTDIIQRCCEIKADVVKKDEKESGLRMLLNFGHTIGHAIETDSEHVIKHGFAIASGMYLETLCGNKLGYISSDTVNEVERILLDYDFQLKYTPKNPEIFTESMKSDKKAGKNGILLSLTEPLGSGKILKDIDPYFITKLLTGI